MIRIFRNSRGLRDLAKHKFLSDLVKEEQISFIALSETGRDEFPDRILKTLCAAGTSSGIVWPLMVDLEAFYWVWICRFLILEPLQREISM